MVTPPARPSKAGVRSPLSWFALLVLGAWLGSAERVPAVILFRTDDPAANTSPPDGPLTNSGWQWQGRWGAFLGTPISSNVFVTARHVGGTPGEAIVLDGRAHGTIAYQDHPRVDLRLWCVCQPFKDVAPLYTRTDEVGRPIVFFGRGTRRGEPVQVNDTLKGWRWGASDGRIRWGENQIAAVTDAAGTPAPDPASPDAILLQATFDAGAGPNEAHLSTGDSGGAMFIQENGAWKLAGILHAVDGPYNLGTSGGGFFAALFDIGGLHEWTSEEWLLQDETITDQPSAFYATRIAPHLEWIQSTLLELSAASTRPHLESAADLAGAFTDTPDAPWNPANLTFQIPVPDQARFYRVRGCTAWRILNIEAGSRFLTLRVQAADGD